MANTTFSGPVRSENGFKVVSKNSTTGASLIQQLLLQQVSLLTNM